MRSALSVGLFFFLLIAYAAFLFNFAHEPLPPTQIILQQEHVEIITIDPSQSLGVFSEPRIFSSEELSEMIARAPHYTQTRPMMSHPARKMTERERAAWIADYNALGGMNAQELELYKIINEVRADHDLPPLVLCPRLSMAARLFSYLQVKYHSVGHIDPYYDDLMQRSNFFGAYGSLYKENANSQQWYVMADGSIEYVYLSPQQLVDGWLSSDGHREHILTTDTTHVGFGVDSGRNRVVPTMKSIMPR
jgi:uncharacterized protein YkwD